MSKKGKNIFKRKDGRWEARYIKSYDADGRIRYGYCYGKTYREAKEKVTKYKAVVHTSAVSASDMRMDPRKNISQYCDEWLEHRKKHLKESTYLRYIGLMERHIKPFLGEYLPSEVTAALIDEFSRNLSSEKHLSPKTVKDILVLLNSILHDISEQFPGMFMIQPMVYPKEKAKDTRILSRDEQVRFTEYLLENMDICRFGILLALFTGMRIGELCALQWKDISLEESTVRIEKTIQRVRNLDEKERSKTKILIDTPKSERSLRVIPLTDYTTEHCRRMFPGSPSAFVLTGTSHYMEPRILQYRLNRYTKECGMDGVHFHTLRHTFATRCVEVGFDVKSLSEILGHANTTITLERYVHPSLQLKRENMKKLELIGL